MTYDELYADLKNHPVVVDAGKCEGHPSFSGQSSSGKFAFYFMLDEDWLQLYNYEDNSTHKIAGLKDSFLGLMIGYNSARLGLRCNFENNQFKYRCFVPVNYIHKRTSVTYQHLQGAPFIYPGQIYLGKVYQMNGFVRVSLAKVTSNAFKGISIGTEFFMDTPMTINSPKTSGVWVEDKWGESPCEVTTYLKIVNL